MLHDLAAQESTRALGQRLGRYCQPQLLCVDEVGYLSYDGRYADLLFEVVTRRYNLERSIVLTTNKAFGEWAQVFPNAACVVTLVDRLMHRAELSETSRRRRGVNNRSVRERRSLRSPATRSTASA